MTHKAFFDVKIADRKPERIEFGLYGYTTPKTSENFLQLTKGSSKLARRGRGPYAKPMTFKGSKFHRIIPGFMAQGGDFTHGTGVGGESIFGMQFEDENHMMAASNGAAPMMPQRVVE